jgi:hypothetical protein
VVGHVEQGEEPVAAPLLLDGPEVLSVPLQPRGEPPLPAEVLELLPRDGEEQQDGVLRGNGQALEVVGGDDPGGAAAGPAAEPEELRVDGPGGVHQDGGLPVGRRHEVDAGEVVGGQPVHAREQPVPAAADVAAGPDRVAGAARQGHVGGLVHLDAAVPVGGAGPEPVGVGEGLLRAGVEPPTVTEQEGLRRSVAVRGEDEVDDDPAGIVGDEALVAVPAAADRDALAGAAGVRVPLLRRRDEGRAPERLREGVEDVLLRGADVDLLGPLGSRAGPALVKSAQEGSVAAVC